MFDPTILPSLHEDAECLETLLESGLLAVPDQVNVGNHLLGLRNSIAFIEKMGHR
jgi:hypothetical protein